MTTASPPFEELLGVYDADGGLRGELAYVVGHVLGLRECALCDITHSPVRRKREWDLMMARLPIPLTVLHRNEIRPDLAQDVLAHPLPAVFGLRASTPTLVLGPGALASMAGSVSRFEERLLAALDQAGDAT